MQPEHRPVPLPGGLSHFPAARDQCNSTAAATFTATSTAERNLGLLSDPWQLVQMDRVFVQMRKRRSCYGLAQTAQVQHI
jgi:hypothetical protein